MKLYFIFICLLNINELLSFYKTEIPEGVYNIILKNRYSSISFNKNIYLSKDKLGSDTINFRITLQKIVEKNKDRNKDNSIYYNIEHLKSKLFLGIKINETIIYPIILNKEKTENETLSFGFKFSKIENNAYIIQNKNGCFLKEYKQKIICMEEKPDQSSHFHLLKIFTEIDRSNKENELFLEKEPIDVLIKYIDLSDPNLVREGVPQIKKDKENEELKYCIRSILKNIPWIRKIFILMPNEKVRFLKNYNLINNKIIYVKDRDFLGYESSNPHAFQYRLWKMKEYGISDNFIIMDDDCFIGQPLKKSDFFYIENNTVVPAIISTSYQVHTQKTFLKEYNNIKKLLKDSRAQSSNTFLYSMYNTYFFFIDYFNSPIIVPYFTHNAIPSNIKDLKEIFDLVNDSKYKNVTLDSISRHIDSLQFQTSVNIYTFNKYSRKVNLVEYNYIDLDKTLTGNFDYPLFCINTGNNKDYSNNAYIEARLVMDKLFPEHTSYEIIDYKVIPKLAYDTMKKMEEDVNNLRNNEDKESVIKLKSENERKKKYVEKCNTIIKKYEIQNSAYFNKSIKLKNELSTYLSKYDAIEKVVKSLEKDLKLFNISSNYEDVKIKLEIKNEEEKSNKIKKNIYENGINENKKLLEFVRKKNEKLYFIAYLEIGLIVILIIFITSYRLKKNLN